MCYVGALCCKWSKENVPNGYDLIIGLVAKDKMIPVIFLFMLEFGLVRFYISGEKYYHIHCVA